jgi:hypothetical protein
MTASNKANADDNEVQPAIFLDPEIDPSELHAPCTVIALDGEPVCVIPGVLIPHWQQVQLQRMCPKGLSIFLVRKGQARHVYDWLEDVRHAAA